MSTQTAPAETTDGGEAAHRLPSLLGNLGLMTSQRDSQLLELSLLRTLSPVLGIVDCSLFRSDETGHVVGAVHHHRSKVVDAHGNHRYVDHMEEINQSIDLSPEMHGLLESARLLRRASHKIGQQGLSMVYPILSGSNFLGYFVFNRDAAPTPTEGASIRGVLEVYSNYFSLLDDSQRDHLTGLLNRQAMERYLTRLWAVMPQTRNNLTDEDGRRRSHRAGYWLAVIDIDHFKRVNDSFGHVIGDEILLLVSRLLGAALRNQDHLFRFGGEEFVAVIAADDDAAALSVMERVRKSIHEHLFPQVGRVTVSVGFSAANPVLLTEEVLSNADRALYYAKDQGRNQVHEYEHLVKTGVFQPVSYGDADLF